MTINAQQALNNALIFLLCLGCANAQECIPAVQYLPLDATQTGLDANGLAPLGSYERVSPDGRFVLRSYSGDKLGQVSLLELNDSGVKAYATPLRNEAFPVQGSWRYVIDVDGSHYHFADLLRDKARAKPLFRGGMTGFYAAAAELSNVNGVVQIRSLSWPNSSSVESQGQGALQVRTITLDTAKHKVIADTGAQFICSERSREDGTFYALPMLSVDGTEFTAMPQTPRTGDVTTRIYSLGIDALKPTCALRVAMDYSSGKATFGFDGSTAFEYRGDVWWYSRALKRDFNMSNLDRPTLASAFPGLTRDGRLIFGATWFVPNSSGAACGSFGKPSGACEKQTGYVVIDPYQQAEVRQAQLTAGGGKACITQAQVRSEREAFARDRGLPQ